MPHPRIVSYSLSEPVLHIHAAIDLDDLTRDIRGEVRGEEECDICDVLGRAAAMEWNLVAPRLLDLIGELIRHSRDDETRGYSVSPDAALAHLLSDGLGEADHASL